MIELIELFWYKCFFHKSGKQSINVHNNRTRIDIEVGREVLKVVLMVVLRGEDTDLN